MGVLTALLMRHLQNGSATCTCSTTTVYLYTVPSPTCTDTTHVFVHPLAHFRPSPLHFHLCIFFTHFHNTDPTPSGLPLVCQVVRQSLSCAYMAIKEIQVRFWPLLQPPTCLSDLASIAITISQILTWYIPPPLFTTLTSPSDFPLHCP